MDTTTIFVVFALAIVAIVALGRPVHGKLNKTGAEIHTYVEESSDEAPEEKLR